MYHYLLILLFLTSNSFLVMAAVAPPVIRGFDISELQYGDNVSDQKMFWNCTYGKGFRKVVVRGYMVRCYGPKIKPMNLRTDE